MKKKLLKCVEMLAIIVFLSNPTYVFADLEDEEEIDVNSIAEEVIETSGTLTDEPSISSKIALIYDRASGRILYEKNGDEQTPMASTTKIMTAIVAIENSNLDDTITIESTAEGTGGSRLGLKKGDKITVRDLLYGLMLRSGNDAAVALAIHISGSIEGFANLMNEKAAELELINTHFVVPHGLDTDDHYTTAYELAKITDYALNIEELKDIVGTKSYTITISGKSKTISNTNELLGNLSGVYGVKTGFTNGAGRCLVTACKRDELDIITVIIGADTKKERTTDSIKLIEYANDNYEVINIKEKIEEEFKEWQNINQGRIVVNKAVESNIELEFEQLEYEKMAIKSAQIDNIKIEINAIYYFEAPVEKGTVIGSIEIILEDETIEMLDIYSAKEMKKKDVIDYMKEFLKLARMKKIKINLRKINLVKIGYKIQNCV